MTNVEYLKTTGRKALDGLMDLWVTMEDREQGGFGTIDAFGRRDFTSDRSVVMQGRTLYGLSAAWRATGDPRCAELAKRLFAHIRDVWTDREYGGVWSGADCRGKALAEEKAVYENAFVLYGLAEYVLAFGDDDALEMAKAIYHGLEKARRLDAAQKGIPAALAGYPDCYCRDWSGIGARSYGRQRSAAGEYGLDNQSHIIEAYANLYRAWSDAGLRARLVELAELACKKLYCPDGQNVCGRYDENWQPLTRDESFGDDLEVAWLIAELGELTGNARLEEESRAVALAMTDRALEKGLDREFGGIFDSIRDGKTETRKMWWCHCEAINACLKAFEMTKNETYLEQAARLWRFYESYLIAPEGYWRGVVRQDGTPMVPEGPRAMPICAYHSIRVCVKTMETAYELAQKT